MSGEFRARTVEPGYIKRWLVDSLELMSRAFVRNTAIAVVFMLPALFLVDTQYDEWASLYYYFAAALMIPLFTVSAEASDLYKPFVSFQDNVIHGCIHVFWLLLIIAIVIALIANVISAFVEPDAAFMAVSTADPAQHTLSFRLGGMLLSSYSIFLIMGSLIWFAPVLSTNAMVKLGQGLVLGTEALAKNPSLIAFPWIVYLVASFMTFSVGALGIPVAAFIGVMMYVSYKDVFLGQGINKRANLVVSNPTPA